ncbi:MAG: hypothetical protein NVS2B12_20030 [Ktedonobacteraceae bacterium]
MGRKMVRAGNRREYFLSYFGPISLIFLLALWAVGLIFCFALLLWGLYIPLSAPEKVVTFGTYLYMSGTTFITLGLGDVIPGQGLARVLAIVEAGSGSALLALIIGYVPVIYQSFSRRETNIALLDARAGSPPSAIGFLRRHAQEQQRSELVVFLRDWEHWCAEVLESHLSYPVLNFYRSQHEHQSWLAALTMILDINALLIVGVDGLPNASARFTFAIARHVAVDLAQNLKTAKPDPNLTRLPPADFVQMCTMLAEVGLYVRDDAATEQRLQDIRRSYEPFVTVLANYLLVPLPPWLPDARSIDDWQSSAWDHFGEWSPAKLAKITELIIEKKKSVIFSLGDETTNQTTNHKS